MGASSGSPLLWFTVLVDVDRAPEAEAHLVGLQKQFEGQLKMLRPYRYAFKKRGAPPHLFYGRTQPFVALGIWAKTSDLDVGMALDTAFSELCERHGYRRCIQTELTRGPEAYERYFGDKWHALRALKQRLDPQALFNRGSVFRSDASAR